MTDPKGSEILAETQDVDKEAFRNALQGIEKNILRCDSQITQNTNKKKRLQILLETMKKMTVVEWRGVRPEAGMDV